MSETIKVYYELLVMEYLLVWAQYSFIMRH